MAHLRAALQVVPDAILITDASERVRFANGAFRRMWRIETSTSEDVALADVLPVLGTHFEDSESFIAGFLAIARDSARESFDLLQLSDGRWIERASHVHRAGHDWFRTWRFTDVTELRRARDVRYEHSRTLDLLGAVGRAIASQMRLEDIVQLVTDTARQLIGAQYAALFYNAIDDTAGEFAHYALSGASPSAFANINQPRTTPLLAQTFRGERIIRYDDLLLHPDQGSGSERSGASLSHLPVRSYLAIPVLGRAGEVHGGLFFGHTDPAMFTEHHEALAQSIAMQAGVALDSARWFTAAQAAQRQLELWNERLEEKVEQRTAELHRSELQFQQLVAGVADYAIYMIDKRGYISSWNPGAERIKGYTAKEIIGKHFSLFYTEEDRAEGRPQRTLEIAEREGKYEAEAWRVRKDGTRFWANVLVDRIRDSQGNTIGFAKVTRDMTERRAMQEQLHQSQKMEAIGQLTGGVAHDFNNLLTVILGNLDSIARKIPEDNERLQRSVKHAMQGAERAATLTRQLLAFARRQPLNPKPTDVNKLVTGMAELIGRTMRENIVIQNVLSESLWLAEVDPHQLESALLNLAVNARDAMPMGGTLTIETANTYVHGQGGAIDMAPGEYVLITVTDTGAGMTSEVMARAFDPFFTTKPIGEGTGLGLSQVFGFVKQSGGHVRLRSRVGEGTTVCIYLPRVMSGEQPAESTPRSTTPRGLPNEVILVVEDDDDVRIYTTESLRELGFAVLEAHDGKSALRVLEHHPEICLLFTDVGLPGMNGRELVDKARLARPDLRILFTTGYERSALMHDGRLDPGVELLTKPFTRAQLASRIRSVLDSPMEPLEF